MLGEACGALGVIACLGLAEGSRKLAVLFCCYKSQLTGLLSAPREPLQQVRVSALLCGLKLRLVLMVRAGTWWVVWVWRTGSTVGAVGKSCWVLLSSAC